LSTSSTSTRTVTAPSTASVRDRAGTLAVLGAACLWGTTGTVRTAVPDAGNASIGAVRLVLGGAVLLVLALSRHRPALRALVAQPRRWLLLVPGAAAMVTYQVAFFHAADRTGVAVGTVVTIAGAPPFAGLLALITGQSRPTRRWVGATIGAALGCGLLVGGGGDIGVDPVGIALALLAGFAYAGCTTIIAALLRHGESDLAVTGVIFATAAVMVVPLLVAEPPSWVLDGRGLVVALYLGCIATAGSYLLFGRGLRTTPAPTATTLTLIEPAIASMLGLVILHEHLAPTAYTGLALLATSLAVLALPARRVSRRPPSSPVVL
jgi:drug/metabolite transporter, DME family